MRRFAVLGLIAIVGCGKKEPPDPAEGATSAKPAATQTKPAAKGDEPAAPTASVAPKKVVDDRTIHAFAGTIGKDQKIRLYLERKGDELTGMYASESGYGDVALTGKMKGDDRFELREVVEKGKPVGVFDGWFRGGLLKGTYTDGKTKKAQVFVTQPLKLGAEPFTATYAGALGGKLRIRARLTRKGGTVEGVYRYAKSKEDLTLTGTVDGEGELVLTERTKAGKETGRIEGFVLSQDLVVGRWYSPDKSKTMSLLLEPSESYPEVVDLGGVKIAPQEDYKDVARFCTSSLIYPSVDGGKGKAALNAELRKHGGTHMTKGDCDGASAEIPYVTERSYHVQKSKLPYFGITFHDYWNAGGAHPNWSSTCKVADAETGELFSLARKLSPEAREKLSALVMKKLQAEHGVTKLSEAGFFEDEIKVDESTDVCLAEGGGLSVEFDPYEVAPYVMGGPTAEISKEEAKELLPKELVTLVE